MKSALFVSPNLKLMMLLAALLALLQQFIVNSEESNANLCDQAQLYYAASDVEEMLDRTFARPTAENYEAVSQALLRTGDVRGAMFYLRKAHMAAALE